MRNTKLALAIPPADPTAVEDPVEAEMQKDVWDVRNIPWIAYPKHRSEYYLKFTKVPLPFRSLAKRYVRFYIGRYKFASCRYQLQYLPRFLNFYQERYPAATGLRDLSRPDVEAYLIHLHGSTIKDGKPASQNHVFRAVSVLQQFLEYLERTSAQEAPALSVTKLVWPEDKCRHPNRSTPGEDVIKYIPESVLAQLDQYVHELPPRIIPVVALLRASGWRISDVLNLRYDTCLERSPSGWWLRGDIQKTEVLAHKVPITEEIARIVTAQREVVERAAAGEHNPDRYLFPSVRPGRRGRPMGDSAICKALNNLAGRRQITNDLGRVYHFNLHAFRHTKGVELINNGMNLLYVQKWMAHASPEMSLAYARILDPTMREQWEKAFAQGAVRIDNAGKAAVVAPEAFNEDQIEWEYIRHNLDAVRLPSGYCFKPRKAECPTQAIPCHACYNFCTTPAFLPEFHRMRHEMTELIQIGQDAGRTLWVQRNQQNLEKLTPIIELLEQGKLHHPAGKTGRENVAVQENPQNAA